MTEKGSFTVFRIPRSHWHCQLDNFAWSAVTPRSLQTHVVAFTAGVNAGAAPHMLLTGAPGCGKTHIGVGVYRAMAAALGTALVTWINVPAFCESVKRGYGSEADPWQEYEEARRLVVLDDLFGRELTAHEKDQIVTRLIDTAYTRGAGIFATMNPDAKELSARLPPHEISRLLADCTIIPVAASKDWRRDQTVKG